jgi:hypothetical protein
MRALGVIVIVGGFILVWAFFAVYWTAYQAKRLASKQGRQEMKAEITDTVTFIAKDKDFHQALNKEFRGTYILFGVLLLAILASALGIK